MPLMTARLPPIVRTNLLSHHDRIIRPEIEGWNHEGVFVCIDWISYGEHARRANKRQHLRQQ